jgi:predicted DNA-binding transcriptional regulator AlpA
MSSKVAELVGDCFLNRKDIAGIFSMTPGAVSVALSKGTFPIAPIRIGRRIRWRLSDVKKFIEYSDNNTES